MIANMYLRYLWQEIQVHCDLQDTKQVRYYTYMCILILFVHYVLCYAMFLYIRMYTNLYAYSTCICTYVCTYVWYARTHTYVHMYVCT